MSVYDSFSKIIGGVWKAEDSRKASAVTHIKTVPYGAVTFSLADMQHSVRKQ